jgi:hypothetical protein
LCHAYLQTNRPTSLPGPPFSSSHSPFSCIVPLIPASVTRLYRSFSICRTPWQKPVSAADMPTIFLSAPRSWPTGGGDGPKTRLTTHRFPEMYHNAPPFTCQYCLLAPSIILGLHCAACSLQAHSQDVVHSPWPRRSFPLKVHPPNKTSTARNQPLDNNSNDKIINQTSTD